MQDPHCSQLGHITGSLRPECNPYEHVDKKRWWFWRSWRWDEIKWATFVTALSTLPGSSLSKRSVAPWIICNQMQLLRITMKLWRNWLDGNSRICCWPKQQRDDEESRQRLESQDSEPRWAPTEGRPVTIIILLRVDWLSSLFLSK